jgi:Zn-dependent metalloprotease
MSLSRKTLSFAVLMALAGTAAAANADHPAVGRALGLIQTHGSALRTSGADQFQVRDVIVNADGTEHVRFNRTYAGLPVIGGDFVIHSKGGQFKGASLTQSAPINLSTNAKVKPADAIVAAGVEFGSGFTGTPSASPVVFARNGAPKLAYQVNLRGLDKNGHDVDMTYFVDAKNGKVLDRYSNLHTANATATFRTIYSGTVTSTTNSVTGGYEMRDNTRGGGWTGNAALKGRSTNAIFTDADNTWGNGAQSDAASAAADAQFGVGMTWDFYKNTFGRNGIANDGKGASNRVHYGRNYVNAYWSDSCFCMTYGDGDGVNYGPLVNIDVAGHEMSHGVTSRSANLTYSGESGGLNEATSDIMGTMVEFYANSPNDVPDYLIGEKIYIKYPAGNKALRYMYNPIADGQSPNCYSSSLGSLDVHYSSGVANHFFYLLAEGSGSKTFNGVNHTSTTCNGSSLAGIGRDAAQRIWYKALTTYMTSSTNYHGARLATISAAESLYGVGSAQANAVAATWSAVSVN